MSAQTNRFKRAAKVAKKLYKTGRYKRYSDAMSAAFKRIGSASNGHFNKRKSVKKKKAGSRKVKKATPREKVKSIRRTNSTVTTSEIGRTLSGLMSDAKNKVLGNMLFCQTQIIKATTKTDKRKWRKKYAEYLKQYRALDRI